MHRVAQRHNTENSVTERYHTPKGLRNCVLSFCPINKLLIKFIPRILVAVKIVLLYIETYQLLNLKKYFENKLGESWW